MKEQIQYQCSKGFVTNMFEYFGEFKVHINGTNCAAIQVSCIPYMRNLQWSKYIISTAIIIEPVHEKTNNLHRRKQRRRSASR